MKVITISGKAGAGKTTFGNFLAEVLEENGKKAIVFHYADFLKFIAGKYFGYDGDKTKPEMRSLLQHLGTDVFRKNSPDCWVNMAKAFIEGLGDTVDVVIIPDARFKSEVEWLKNSQHEPLFFRIEREGYDNGLTEEQKNHVSETEMDNYEYDFVIENSEDLEGFKGCAGFVVDYLSDYFGIINKEENKEEP